MAHIENTAVGAACAPLPYRLELLADDGRVQDVLAAARSPALAFACYYGALREYVGRPVILRRDGQVIASSRPGN
ncbi:MAG: hypothetical protein ABW042_03075 [Phenylobacterium sp.]